MPSFFSRLFGTSVPAAPKPVLHKEFRIFPQPVREGGVYRIAARIEKDIGGVTKTQSLIRADTVFPPFLTGCTCRTYAAVFSFWVGVMPPMPMFGRSLL